MLTMRKFRTSGNRAVGLFLPPDVSPPKDAQQSVKVGLAANDRIFPRNWTERTLEHVARSRGMLRMYGMSRSDSLSLADALDSSTNDLHRSRGVSHSRTPHALHSMTKTIINPSTLIIMQSLCTISHLSLPRYDPETTNQRERSSNTCARVRVRWSTDARYRTPRVTAADFSRNTSATPFVKPNGPEASRSTRPSSATYDPTPPLTTHSDLDLGSRWSERDEMDERPCGARNPPV